MPSIMTSRQAAELDHAFERNGWTAEDVKKLSKGDVLTRILKDIRGQVEAKKDVESDALLEFIGTITLPARTEKFVVRDHFVVDKSKKAKVKISYLGDNLKANFLGKIEETITESTLRYAKLLRSSVDKLIIKDLGGEENAETTLAEMFGLMELQPNGEDGTLLTNGYANIFYIRDINGVLWAVHCYWDDDGWRVYANSLGLPGVWRAARRVFSCNSSAPQS